MSTTTTDSTTSTTDIDNARTQRKENQNGKRGHWVAFGLAVIKNFIITLCVGILGANFIYWTSREASELNVFFPTEEETYFPRGFPQDLPPPKPSGSGAGAPQQGGNFEHCTPKRLHSGISTIIGGQLPYRLANYPKSEWDFKQFFYNWVARSTADSFMFSRGMFKGWLEFFAPNSEADGGGTNIFSNNIFQMFIAAPLTLFMTILVIYFVIIMAVLFTFQAGFWWFIIGILCFYTWVLDGGIALIQVFQYLKTLLLVPITLNWRVVKGIIGCNLMGLIILFGWLVCASASALLQPTISIVMWVFYFFICLKMLWTNVFSKWFE